MTLRVPTLLLALALHPLRERTWRSQRKLDIR